MLNNASAACEISVKREADAPPETELSSKVARKTPADVGEAGPPKKTATELVVHEPRKKPLPSFGAPAFSTQTWPAASRRPSSPAPRDACLVVAFPAEVRYIEADPGFAPEPLRDAAYKDLGKLTALFADDKYLTKDVGARGEYWRNGREGALFWLRRVRSHLAVRLGFLPDEVFDPASAWYKYDLAQVRPSPRSRILPLLLLLSLPPPLSLAQLPPPHSTRPHPIPARG